MPLTILAAMVETATQSNYLWLLAASALPLALVAKRKKKKLGLFKKLLLGLVVKKISKYKKKKPEKNIALGILLVVLILGLSILVGILLGWLWALVALLVLIYGAGQFIEKRNH